MLLFTKIALRLYPWRWWLVVVSITGALCVFALLAGESKFSVLAIVLAGPLIFGVWGLVCACFWFHPQHGSLVKRSGFLALMPKWMWVATQWYAAAFLCFYIVVAIIVWPALTITWWL